MIPTLYLYIDHTHLSPWANASLNLNKNILASYQIELAPPLSGDIPRWSDYWYHGANDPENSQLVSMFAKIHLDLQNGQNVLLPGAYFDFDVTRKFLEKIKSEFGSLCDIKGAVFFEKPSLMFDWWWRRAPEHLQKVLLNTYLYNSTHTSKLFRNIQNSLGNDSVQFFFSDYQKLDSGIIGDHLEKLFQFLRVQAKPAVSKACMNVDWLFTNNAKIALESFEVRQNTYPHLDQQQIFDCVREWEREQAWSTGVPWEARKRFLKKEAMDRAALRLITGIDQESLAPPSAFLEPVDKYLDENDVKSLFSFWTPENRVSLFKRLDNDAILLSETQTRLLRVLRDSGEFSSLREVDAPPRLAVLTLAYNHQKYIGDCMNSVLSQKTDFPVRHIVVDNYSTDSTGDIIREYADRYPSIQAVLLKGEQPHYNGVYELFNRARTEYVSICEGDDYFIDNFKLRKQVSFLEENKDCAISFHPVLVHFEDSSHDDFIYPSDNVLHARHGQKFGLESLFAGNYIQTNSVVYRWRFKAGLPDWFDASLCPADWYWHLLHAETGLIGFMSGAMSVYRRHGNALYKHAFIDSFAHRKKSGLSELRTYAAIYRHFGDKCKDQLNQLAGGVFSDLLLASVKEDNSVLLEQATEAYPQFAKYFLKCVDIQAPHAKRENS